MDFMKSLLALLSICFLFSPNSYAEKLIVGTSFFDPPMEMQATKSGVFMGFEIELIKEVCRRIKATCVYKPLPFEDIMAQTLAGKVDLGIDGFFITKERMADYLFSEPYLQTKAQLFTVADSNIDSSNVNTGRRIGVEAGTVFKALLLNTYNNIKVVGYKRQEDMLQDLADHKIDLIMFDLIGASYWVNSSQGTFKLVGKAASVGMGYGILANRSKGALITRINSALNDMENDGTYLSIYSRYF
jgi:arginine transport system substrate-binding protein